MFKFLFGKKNISLKTVYGVLSQRGWNVFLSSDNTIVVFERYLNRSIGGQLKNHSKLTIKSHGDKVTFYDQAGKEMESCMVKNNNFKEVVVILKDICNVL